MGAPCRLEMCGACGKISSYWFCFNKDDLSYYVLVSELIINHTTHDYEI
jgi:hypothetical protein